jgi:type IV secretory pathway VirB9-like protein
MRKFLIATVLLAGCATQPPPPIIVQQAPPPKPQIVIPPDPYQGLPADVVAAIKSGSTDTIKNGITTIYPYSPDVQWTLNCQPLEATEIRLAPDEYTDKDNTVLGDSVRWDIKIGGQAVMVKPLGDAMDPKMQTNLVIHTDKRSYHLLLRIHKPFSTAIAWYYPDTVKAEDAARQAAIKEAAAQGNQTADPPTPATTPATQTEASQR